MRRKSLLKTLGTQGLIGICATFLSLTLSAPALGATITLDLQTGDEITKFHPGAQIPVSEIVTISGITTGDDVDTVVVGLDGILNAGTWGDGQDGDIATFLIDVNDDGTFIGQLDLTKGNHILPNNANDVTIHAFAFPDTEDAYETSVLFFSGFNASDSAEIKYIIKDSIPSDNDKNGIPNATLISNSSAPANSSGSSISGLTPNGADLDYEVTRHIVSLDQGLTPAQQFPFSHEFILGTGQRFDINVFAPNLAWLKLNSAADPDIASALNAVLVVRGESDGQFILDDELLDTGINPAAEFNFGDEVPAIYFHVTILLETSAGIWEELDLNPINYPFDVIIQSHVMTNAISDTVKLYRYSTSTNQPGGGENINITGNAAGWFNVTPHESFNDSDFGGLLGSITLRERTKGSLYALTYTLAGPSDPPDVDPPNIGNTSGGGGGGCFIATAAYGTPMAQEVESLRDVRDGYLLHTTLGTAFVDTYYRLSPPVADYIADHAALRLLVRMVLTPIVMLAQLFLASPALIMAGMGALALLLVRRRRARVA